MHLEFTELELATAACACRAMAYQEEARAEQMQNPKTRGPVEAAARCFGHLAAKLEAAQKGYPTGFGPASP